MPGLIWRGLYLDDNRVFYGQEDVYTPNFTVDIMLDASASRGEYQRVIAAQPTSLQRPCAPAAFLTKFIPSVPSEAIQS